MFRNLILLGVFFTLLVSCGRTEINTTHTPAMPESAARSSAELSAEQSDDAIGATASNSRELHAQEESSWDASTREGFVTTQDGIRLYVRTNGVPEGPAIIIPFASLFADGDFKPLESNYRLIFYDMRGRGRSDSVDAADISFGAEIRDLDAVRRSFRLDRVTLLGVSMLGSTCLHYALHHPEHVERVVAVNPLPPRAIPYMAELETPRTSGRVPAQVLEQVDELIASGMAERDPIAFAAAYNDVLVPYACAVPAGSAPAWARFPTRIPNEWAGNASIACGSLIDTLGLWDWRSELTKLDVPVLVIYGTEDYNPRPDAAEELAALLPQGQLLVLEGAGHFAHVARREKFFHEIRTFLGNE